VPVAPAETAAAFERDGVGRMLDQARGSHGNSGAALRQVSGEEVTDARPLRRSADPVHGDT
jgi:hypothetical protein